MTSYTVTVTIRTHRNWMDMQIWPGVAFAITNFFNKEELFIERQLEKWLNVRYIVTGKTSGVPREWMKMFVEKFPNLSIRFAYYCPQLYVYGVFEAYGWDKKVLDRIRKVNHKEIKPMHLVSDNMPRMCMYVDQTGVLAKFLKTYRIKDNTLPSAAVTVN